MHISNNVNHKNMILMWNYLLDFAKKNHLKEDDVNIFDQLDIDYPSDKYKDRKSYYIDRTQWSPLNIYVKCYLQFKKIIDQPNIYNLCGRSILKLASMPILWEMIGRSFNSISGAINLLPKVMPDWNDTKVLEILDPAEYRPYYGKTRAILRYKFHDHIEPESDYCSDPHIRGIIEAIPTAYPKNIWRPKIKYPIATVKQTMVQYDPIKLFNSVFFINYNLSPHFKENILHITDPISGEIEPIGRKVVLKKSMLNGRSLYLGDYKETFSGNTKSDLPGTLINKTIIAPDGEIICEEGTLYNSPHFLLKIESDELSPIIKLWNLNNVFRKNSLLVNDVVQLNNNLKLEIEERKQKNEELLKYKGNLEDLVKKKTGELKEAHRLLAKKQQKKMEGRITGGFAHEVRNGLTGAQLAIKSLSDYKCSGKAAKRLFDESIEKLSGSSRLNDDGKKEIIKIKGIGEDTNIVFNELYGAIENVLSLTSQIRSYAKALHLKAGGEKVGIKNVILLIKKRNKRILDKHNVELSIDGPDLYFRAEKNIFISIFENIILNAVDAISEKCPDKGKIRIIIENGEQIKISVKDNGIGVKKANKVFDPFYTNKEGGSGLGLSITKRFVNTHGGKIYVKSVLGAEYNTEFFLMFKKSILWKKNGHENSDNDCG